MRRRGESVGVGEEEEEREEERERGEFHGAVAGVGRRGRGCMVFKRVGGSGAVLELGMGGGRGWWCCSNLVLRVVKEGIRRVRWLAILTVNGVIEAWRVSIRGGHTR